jgi:glycerol-3-phosphate acyltransferase PlsX
MNDDPARALRDKKDSSIRVTAALVASGKAGGMVSAGSTGAAIAAAAFIIGRLPGVSRPAIATLFPGDTVVLDSGANLTCRPEDLAQFGHMGAALAQSHFAVPSPRVGLLNIGEEAGKGRDLEKRAHGLLAELDGIDFVGNVEGRDIATSKADVFVTDGFVGNVVLKTAEGAGTMLLALMRDIIASQPAEAETSGISAAFGDLFERLQPEATGGAHLLGTKGVVVIAHGSSSRHAVANAIALADEGVRTRLVDKIASGMPEAGDDPS